MKRKKYGSGNPLFLGFLSFLSGSSVLLSGRGKIKVGLLDGGFDFSSSSSRPLVFQLRVPKEFSLSALTEKNVIASLNSS